MALRDEIQELLVDAIASTRAGRVWLEEGGLDEERARRAGIGVPELLETAAVISGAHRDALMRLADEIDALRAERS